MSPLKFCHKLSQKGFTIIELSVVIVVTGLAAIALYTVFNTSFLNYLGLEQESSQFNNIAQESQRVATVVRGLTDITSATANDIKFYAYFSPNDTYVSFCHYYVSGTTTKSLLAEITPMSSNPPTGSLLTAKQRNYTIIDKYGQSSANLFDYLDSAGATLIQPVSDLHTIKGIRINLSQDIGTKKQPYIYTSSLTVSLRNRKTNL